MKNMCLKSMLLVIMLSCWYAVAEMSLDINAAGHEKVRLALASFSAEAELASVMQTIKKDFEFYGQFSVEILTLQEPLTKKSIAQLYNQGYKLALFLNATQTHEIEWRLYSTHNSHMIKGKKYSKRGSIEREWAHHIADMVLPVLSGKPGSFSTKIAYCKQVPLSNGRHYKHIYIADYDGSNEQKLVGKSTINVAPRWNKDLQNPLLFYSECTNSNIRLMATDLHKHHKIVSNFDGLNMLPAFSNDGSKVVYCASRGDGSCHLYYYAHGTFKRLTRNNGNNISPVFSDNDDMIFFCSDFQTGLPQIYSYHLHNDTLERLTENGYCASPAYCGSNKMLAYTKLVKGVNQLFVYDLAKKEHRQITFDGANKEECSWSNCGNYIICCVAQGASSRIALFDLNTQERRFITSEKDHCSYPAWSPSYHEFPSIVC